MFFSPFKGKRVIQSIQREACVPHVNNNNGIKTARTRDSQSKSTQYRTNTTSIIKLSFERFVYWYPLRKTLFEKVGAYHKMNAYSYGILGPNLDITRVVSNINQHFSTTTTTKREIQVEIGVKTNKQTTIKSIFVFFYSLS